MKTLAAVLVKQKHPLELMELDIPELGVGHVLVDVKAAGICGAQLGEHSGTKGPDRHLPHLLGHEGAGFVLAVGPGVRKVKEGDFVVLHWRKGSGIDAEPPKYKMANGCIAGAGPVATFATKAVVSENRCTPILPEISPVVAALLGCGVTTGLGLINNEAKVKIGESVLVAGAGGVGLNVIQGAVMAGAFPVYAAEPNEGRRNLAEKYGAIPFPSIDAVGKLKVDVFVDCTGLPGVIECGFNKLSTGGRMILVGQTPVGKAWNFENARQHYVGKTILDSQGGLTDPDKDIPRYAHLILAGKLSLGDMVGQIFPLTDVNQALSASYNAAPGRTMLVMG